MHHFEHEMIWMLISFGAGIFVGAFFLRGGR